MAKTTKKKPTCLVESKFQTTKVIVFSILLVWSLVTFAMLGLISFGNLEFDQMSGLQSVYQLVTVALVQGVIGYVVKSTIENKSKYGDKPYGNSLNTLVEEIKTDVEETVG